MNERRFYKKAPFIYVLFIADFKMSV